MQGDIDPMPMPFMLYVGLVLIVIMLDPSDVELDIGAAA